MLCFCLRDVVILQLHPIYRVHSGWVVLQLDCSKGGFFSSSHGFILVVGLSAAVVPMLALWVCQSTVTFWLIVKN